jgi:BioD-like phosphotransacetylase family protein
MGAREIFFGGGLSELSDSLLVKMFNATVLLVDRYQRDNLTLYSLLSLNSFLEGRVKSAIINHIAPDHLEHVKAKVLPFLKEKGLRSVIAIPESPILAALTVFTITHLIGGEIFCLPELGGNLIETFTTGLKNLEGPLALFKQVYNKIVLVGLKQTPEEQKAIGGIILTGGRIPSEIVCKVAQERSIPLILTQLDTFQAMERLEQAKPSLGIKDEFKVRHFLKLMDQEMGANQWVETLL